MPKKLKRKLNLPRVPIARPTEDVIPDKSKRIPRKAKHKKSTLGWDLDYPNGSGGASGW